MTLKLWIVYIGIIALMVMGLVQTYAGIHG